MNSEFYMYISSTDSVNTFPTNTASDFSVLLPDRIRFNPIESWNCGLVELIIPNELNEPAFLCSNFCQPSIVGERRLPVLRRIIDLHVDPSHVNYVPIRCSELAVLQMYLTDSTGQKLSLTTGTTYCTLHFVQNEGPASSNRS